MTARVVHCKREPYDVYIGRPGKWGNPFTHTNSAIAEFFVATRDEAVRRYKTWVQQQPGLIEDLSELRGKTLGCWCAPKPCHGDVLLKLANDVQSHGKVKL